jgi:hypothetical protein
MRVQAFELIVEKDPETLNQRVNAKIALGWDVMFGCSGMNQTATKFCVWMAESVPPAPPKPRHAAVEPGVPAEAP